MSAKAGDAPRCWPSMKVPPKRKGNLLFTEDHAEAWSLNESPSEKEGKSFF